MLFSDQNTDKVDYIKNGTMDTFQQDVLVACQKQTVFVYFSSLSADDETEKFGAMLEKYVKLAKGKVVLVKYMIESNQQLAMQLGVRQLPTTLIFAHGTMADGFAGTIKENQLKQVMQALAGSAVLSLDELLKNAQTLLNEGKTEEALQAYSSVLEQDESNPNAFAGMIRCFIASKQFDAAKDLSDNLEESVKSPELDAAKKALTIALENKDAPDVGETKARLDKNPADLQARYNYAFALFGAGECEQAIDELLTIFMTDKEWNNDAARQLMFKIFTVLGPSDPITLKGRRKLSSAVFM